MPIEDVAMALLDIVIRLFSEAASKGQLSREGILIANSVADVAEAVKFGKKASEPGEGGSRVE